MSYGLKCKSYEELCQVPVCNFMTIDQAGMVFRYTRKAGGQFDSVIHSAYAPFHGETFEVWLERNSKIIEIVEEEPDFDYGYFKIKASLNTLDFFSPKLIEIMEKEEAKKC